MSLQKLTLASQHKARVGRMFERDTLATVLSVGGSMVIFATVLGAAP